jgi:hypothetical protein
MQRFPHSDEPEISMRVELWVGVTPSGRSPVIWIPMKRGSEGGEAKGGGIDQDLMGLNPADRSEQVSLLILFIRLTSLSLYPLSM